MRKPLVTFNDVENALRDLAGFEDAAEARGLRIDHEKQEKAVLARARLKYGGKTVQERDDNAHKSGEYQEWLSQYKQLVIDDEAHKGRRAHAETIISVYQTSSANQRARNV